MTTENTESGTENTELGTESGAASPERGTESGTENPMKDPVKRVNALAAAQAALDDAKANPGLGFLVFASDGDTLTGTIYCGHKAISAVAINVLEMLRQGARENNEVREDVLLGEVIRMTKRATGITTKDEPIGTVTMDEPSEAVKTAIAEKLAPILGLTPAEFIAKIEAAVKEADLPA